MQRNTNQQEADFEALVARLRDVGERYATETVYRSNKTAGNSLTELMTPSDGDLFTREKSLLYKLESIFQGANAPFLVKEVTAALQSYSRFQSFAYCGSDTFSNMRSGINSLCDMLNIQKRSELLVEQDRITQQLQARLSESKKSEGLTTNEMETLKKAFPEGSIQIGTSRNSGDVVLNLNNSALLATIQKVLNLDKSAPTSKNDKHESILSVNVELLQQKLKDPQFQEKVKQEYVNQERSRVNFLFVNIIKRGTNEEKEAAIKAHGMLNPAEGKSTKSTDKNTLFQCAESLSKIFYAVTDRAAAQKNVQDVGDKQEQKSRGPR